MMEPQASRRPLRRAMLLAAATAAVLASAAPALASGWTTTAIVVGRPPGTRQLSSDFSTKTFAASVRDGASASINPSPGAADHPQSIIDAGAAVGPGRIDINAFSFVGANEVQDHTLSAATALISGSDQLTISGGAGAGRLVTLHKTISLETFANNKFVGLSGDRGDPDGDWQGSATSTLHISGTGIGPGKYGPDLFDITTEAFGRDSIIRDHRTPPTFIDFTFNFFLGQAQDLFMSLNLTNSTDLDDRDGSFYGNTSVSKGYILRWMDGGSLTDAATGQAVCGASSQSDSGFNYLAGIPSSPCQTGGGGGPGDGGGAVPEPAAWALMITGFGLAGASLRRRRACVVS